MLPFTEYGTGATTLVMMPFLAGSQREWTEVVEQLSKRYRCITVDLPGFGEAAAVPGYSVAEMVAAVTATLASLNLERYLLVGHSMAGKLVAVIARHIADGDSPVPRPLALVLVAPSPPGSEPMSDSKRKEMLEAFLPATSFNTADARKHAEKYIAENSTRDIPQAVVKRTVDDVLKMNPAAWTAWLESGSKEDWAAQVGIIDLPTLLVAGANDGSLGPAAQQECTMPFFPKAHLIAVDTNHLIPLEAPEELIALISNFIQVF